MATVNVNGTQITVDNSDARTMRILQNGANVGQNPLKIAGYALVPNGTAGYYVDAAGKNGKVLLTFYYNRDGSISSNLVQVVNGDWLSKYGGAFDHPVDTTVQEGYADQKDAPTPPPTQGQPQQQQSYPTSDAYHQDASGQTFTPAGQDVAGGADPNQPFGAGFGGDYGLDPNNPGGFTGETGPANPPPGPNGAPAPVTPNAGVTYPDSQVQTTGVQQVLDSPGTTRHPADRGQPGPPSVTGTPPPKPPFGKGHSGSSAVTSAPAAATTAATTTTGTTTTGASGPNTSSGSTDQKNALATLTQILQQYGLGSLASWAWNEIVNGASEPQVLLDMMNTPEFKQRFPGIEARQKAGLPPISPADYVNYEAQATQMMRAAGLPAGFWDSPSDFTALISSDVSLNELSQRVNLAAQAAYQVPGDVRAVLQRDYGITSGDLAANFLDPKQAEPVLARKFTAAQIGGAAYRTGYGSSRNEDEYLTDLGVNAQQAQQGFTQLTGQRQLFSSLPGENAAGISRDMQLGAEFAGNTLDQEAVTRRAQQRVGVFSGGGGFGTTQQGFAVGNAQGV